MSDWPSELPGLNINLALSQLGGKKSLYLRLLAMFKDSHRVLKKGGELRIIGNRQLAYHIKLKRLFGNETLIASNDKFVTQSAIKR